MDEKTKNKIKEKHLTKFKVNYINEKGNKLMDSDEFIADKSNDNKTSVIFDIMTLSKLGLTYSINGNGYRKTIKNVNNDKMDFIFKKEKINNNDIDKKELYKSSTVKHKNIKTG